MAGVNAAGGSAVSPAALAAGVATPAGTAAVQTQAVAAMALRGVVFTSDYGAKHDCNIVTGCSVSGTAVTIPGGALTSADVGKEIAGSDVLTGGDWKSLGSITAVGGSTTCTVSIAGDVTTSATTKIVWGTNDKAALQTAFLAAAGKELVFSAGNAWIGAFAPGTYNIFTVTTAHKPKRITGYGSTITCVSLAPQTTPSVVATSPVIFKLVGPVSDYYLAGLTLQDLGADPMSSGGTGADRGAYGHFTDRTAGDIRRITLRDYVVIGGFAGFTTYNPGSFVIEHIVVDNCYFENCYYGCAFDECGDYFTGNYRTKQNRRNYYPHGVQHHNVRFVAENNRSASAACLVKSYGKPSKNITIHATYIGARDTSPITAPSFVMEQQNDDPTGGGIENVTATIHDIDDTNVAESVVIRSYNTAGTLETTTSKALSKIRLDGDMKTAPTLNTTFTQTPGPDIALGDGLWRLWLAGFPDTKGLIYSNGRSRFKAKRGACTTPLNFEFSDVGEGVHPYVVEAYALADRTSFAGSAATDGFKTFRRKVSYHTGTVSLRPATDDSTGGFQTTDPVLTLTGSGTLLQLTASGSGYAITNSFMSAVVTMVG